MITLRCLAIGIISAFMAPCMNVQTAFGGDSDKPYFVIVVGASGTEEYGKAFHEWAGKWTAACERLNATYEIIGQDEQTKPTDHEKLIEAIREQKSAHTQPLWIVFIGHGTFSRDETKFNLRGPDISVNELKSELAAYPRPLVLINCASSSGPFIQQLSGENRVIIAATRSGAEENYARFGEYFANGLSEIQADLDHDDEVSLLEVFLYASKKVEQFYESEGRLATEHALLDDNGDKLGTPATFFRGIRVVRQAKKQVSPDGRVARRLNLTVSADAKPLSEEAAAKLSALEKQYDELLNQKSKLSEEQYYDQLETIMLQIANLTL